jgi:hypothetical protein
MTSRLSRAPASLRSPARTRHRLRIAALATIALACTVLSAQLGLAHSERYAVKDDDLKLRIENSTFPTWEGTEQKQDLTLAVQQWISS